MPYIFMDWKELRKEHSNEQILKLNRHIKCFVTALGFSPSEEKGKSSRLVPKQLEPTHQNVVSDKYYIQLKNWFLLE